MGIFKYLIKFYNSTKSYVHKNNNNNQRSKNKFNESLYHDTCILSFLRLPSLKMTVHIIIYSTRKYKE